MSFFLTRFAVILCLLASFANETCAQSTRRVPQSDGGVGMYRSANFRVKTDLAPSEAKELLDRLETMLRLVSAYWGRKNPQPIDMFVVEDLSRWSDRDLADIPGPGLDSIRSGAGVTITRVIRSGSRFRSRAIVYAVSKRGTPQHEAVHAYCGHAFGSTGPVWYSEGMAEVGHYWKENDKSVQADDYVIEYLRNTEPKPVGEIVNNPLETTGDSWQNYAWRWALCHLLGFNENYTARFKPLGLALLTGRNASFDAVYGSQRREIEFEYKFFLDHLCRGFRADLCSWDWKARFRKVRGSSKVVSRIAANRGWQASRLQVEAGVTYQVDATGDWTLEDDGADMTADGDDEGRGRLVGILFNDYELSEPFELSKQMTWTAPSDGDLFLRCRDEWGAIDDNTGMVKVEIAVAERPAAGIDE